MRKILESVRTWQGELITFPTCPEKRHGELCQCCWVRECGGQETVLSPPLSLSVYPLGSPTKFGNIGARSPALRVLSWHTAKHHTAAPSEPAPARLQGAAANKDPQGRKKKKITISPLSKDMTSPGYGPPLWCGPWECLIPHLFRCALPLPRPPLAFSSTGTTCRTAPFKAKSHNRALLWRSCLDLGFAYIKLLSPEQLYCSAKKSIATHSQSRGRALFVLLKLVIESRQVLGADQKCSPQRVSKVLKAGVEVLVSSILLAYTFKVYKL